MVENNIVKEVVIPKDRMRPLKENQISYEDIDINDIPLSGNKYPSGKVYGMRFEGESHMLSHENNNIFFEHVIYNKGTWRYYIAESVKDCIEKTFANSSIRVYEFPNALKFTYWCLAGAQSSYQ